jgi:hypothetical protein
MVLVMVMGKNQGKSAPQGWTKASGRIIWDLETTPAYLQALAACDNPEPMLPFV